MYLPDDFSSSGGANCDSKDPHAVVLLLDEAVEEAITPEIDIANLCLLPFILRDTTILHGLQYIFNKVTDCLGCVETLSDWVTEFFCLAIFMGKIELGTMSGSKEDDLFQACTRVAINNKDIGDREVLEQ